MTLVSSEQGAGRASSIFGGHVDEVERLSVNWTQVDLWLLSWRHAHISRHVGREISRHIGFHDILCSLLCEGSRSSRISLLRSKATTCSSCIRLLCLCLLLFLHVLLSHLDHLEVLHVLFSALLSLDWRPKR